MRKRILLSIGILAMACVGMAQNDFVASSDNWGYQGTLTRFNNLTDAQNNTNAVGSYNFDRRDGSLYVLQNRADFDSTYPNYNAIETAWYYTTADNTNNLPKDDPNGDRYYSGWGNPNNTNLSFMQLNETAAQSRVAASGTWTDGSYTSFHLLETGANATYATSFSRLWDGQSLAPDGVFVNYTLDMTFTGLNGQVDGSWITSTNEPTGVTGSLTGIFWNNSTSDTANNGYYVFNMSIDNSQQVWALQQGNAALNGDFVPSVFSAAPVPEPASMAVLGVGALALLRRRKKA